MKTNVTTKIKDIKFGAKEDVITLTIDGNITDQQVSILRNIKNTGVAFVSFSSSQADLDDYKPEELHQGVSGTIDKDGTAHVDSGQMTLEEAAAASEEGGEGEDQDPADGEDNGHDGEDDEEREPSGEEGPPLGVEDPDDLPF